jgi:hypothetical protein
MEIIEAGRPSGSPTRGASVQSLFGEGLKPCAHGVSKQYLSSATRLSRARAQACGSFQARSLHGNGTDGWLLSGTRWVGVVSRRVQHRPETLTYTQRT